MSNERYGSSVADGTGNVTCYVHGTVFPRAACNVHHEMPRAAGGGDDDQNLTWVCASCHTMIHRIAEAVMANKAGRADDLAALYAPNDVAMRERLRRLGGYAADSTLRADDEGAGADDVTVQFVLSRGLAQRLRLLVRDVRANGRAVSMQAFLHGLVVRELTRANLVHGVATTRKPRPTKT